MSEAQWMLTDTPDGRFALVLTGQVVLASGWTDDADRLLDLVHPSLRPATLRAVTGSEAADAVAAYYDGDLAAPAHVSVRQVSGPFRERAWEALRQVEAGHPVSYSELASRAGNPRAVRAAASACARNAAALFVPCHRVLRSDGATGQFGYGADLKQRLLVREQS